MLVGAHVSVAGGIHHAVDRQIDVGGTCGQVFTHSPQVWREPSLDDESIERFRSETIAAGIGPWVVHSSYLVNLATPKTDLREQSIASLQADVDIAAALGIEFVNVHLGAHTGAGVETGLDNAASALDALDVPETVTVLVESDAGAGTKLGGEFAHLAAVIERADRPLGVCLDTAHAFVAGYDLATPTAVDATIETFDDTVGLDRMRCLHLNDSKHARGSNRDEHEHIGAGAIGEAGMKAIVNHEALADVPVVLETPTDPETGFGFAENIERVRALRE